LDEQLGKLEDIEHDLHAIGGEAYGRVVMILQRATVPPTAGVASG